MFNFDAEKMAKTAMQGLQKAEKLGGSTGEAAKNVLEGVKKVGKLADLPENAPEQVIAALRKLLEEAKRLASGSTNKNEVLDTCISKAQALLDSGDISAAAATKLTAELRALIKGASGEAPKQPVSSGAQKANAASKADTSRNTPNSPAGTQAHISPAPNKRAPQTAEVKVSDPPKAAQFSDVDSSAYYYDAVQWAVRQGIASGTTETTFSPDQDCTRAQTITLLWRAAGSPAPKSKNNPFTDVKETAYYCDAVLWAAERGIVSGTAFNPDAAVTRGQLATFLYRDAGSPAVKNNTAFTDVPNDAYYYQAVNWVAAQGITSGTGEHTFSPDAACTRGQIVTFLYRSKK